MVRRIECRKYILSRCYDKESCEGIKNNREVGGDYL